MDQALLRILDAAANRAREALRVLEDYARFALDDADMTETLKHCRHDFAQALGLLPMSDALRFRDTPGDVGTAIKTESEFRRESWADLVAANARRLSEALRSLEECTKMLNPIAAAAFEKLRYRGYALEQSLRDQVLRRTARDRFARVRLYVLLTQSLCPDGRFESILDGILAAGIAVAARQSPEAEAAGSALPICIQLREKDLPDAELLRRAMHVARRCREAGALAIINDRPDIALMSGADGVHLGQDDVPCDEVRKMLGPEKIIGVSTGALPEAQKAVADGATYVAAGPMFETTTKFKPRIAGPGYAADVLAAVKIPVVAIGGITPENAGELVALGVRTVAVSSAILRAGDAAEVVRKFLQVLRPAGMDQAPKN